MPGEVTLDDVKHILNCERNFLLLVGEAASTDNLCLTKQQIRESRQRLTKALEKLDALIQERELSSLSTARQ